MTTSRRGISILDLLGPMLGAPAGLQAAIPTDIANFFERLAVLDVRSTTSAGAHIHYGSVQSLADMGLPGLDSFIVEGDGITQGLPFQLALTRAPIATGANLEPPPSAFQLDLMFERLAILIHPSALRPATRVASVGSTPSYLLPDPATKQVRIVGSGTIRIASTPTGSIAVTFIDEPDSFDPAAPTGLVASISFEPPNFFIAQSDFGLSVDRLTYDGSTTFTPQAIIDRGHDDPWRGISISQATVFFPRNAPLLGDVSVGVRDVLLGSPAGMQGELLVELGRSPVSPATVTFFQDATDGEANLTVGSGSGTGGDSVLVTLATGTKGAGRVRAVLAQAPTGQPQLSATWNLPDAPLVHEDAIAATVAGIPVLQTRWFQASVGQTARLVLKETPTTGGDPVALPEIAYTFAESTGVPDHLDTIHAEVFGAVFENVVWISGSYAELQRANLVFSSSANTSPDLPILVWDLERSPTPQSAVAGSITTFKPLLPPDVGYYFVTLEGGVRRRRCRITVRASDGVIVGCAKGVFEVIDSGDTTKLKPVSLVGTYNLSRFHAEGVLDGWPTPAVITQVSSSKERNSVGGSLAVVRLENDAAPPIEAQTIIRHMQVFFAFDEADVTTGSLEGGGPRPDGTGLLVDFVKNLNGAQFFTVGHCDDIGVGSQLSSASESREYNKALAATRAKNVLDIISAQTPTPEVFSRSEQVAWDGPGPRPTQTSAFEVAWEAVDDREVPASELAKKANEKLPESYGRPQLRRVDIYAVGGAPTADAAKDHHDDETKSSALRLAYIPGDDLAVITPSTPRDAKLPFVVRLRVGWDSPTATTAADFVPTLAEVTVAWTSTYIPLPEAGGDIKPTKDPTAIKEVFTLVGRWTYDPRAGETTFTFGVDSAGDPDGWFTIVNGKDAVSRAVAVSLGLGPALAAGIEAAGLDGAAVRIGALVALGASLTVISTFGKVAFFGFALEERSRAPNDLHGSRWRILVDYTVEIGFATDLPGGTKLQTDEKKPMRVRYKNVGIQFDDSKTGIARFGFVFENVSFEIVDPGGWSITGKLGEVLRVIATRAGSGSSWMEVDLGFAIDMGVVSIDGATVRLTFDNGGVDVSLRGLAISVDIDGVVSGSGRVKLSPDGTIRAGIDVTIVPAKITARAAFAYNPEFDFFMIDVSVIFSVGIPLGQTGLGIFGFEGLFVSNGKRDLEGLTSEGPIKREVGWFRRKPEDRWTGKRGQWALGLGAMVGTLPDSAFTFSAMGTLVVTFPDVSVIFGINAKLVNAVQVSAPKQGEDPPSGTLVLLGLICIDSSAITIAIDGGYDIPKVLKLHVPAGAYFPFGAGDSFMRVGADGQEGRFGDPVQVTLLPGKLDATAWAYFMVESHRLHKLGGDETINLDGFSIGLGAGFDIGWSAGPFKLSASAKMLVGLGTKPLMVLGKVEIHGEIDLVVVSASVDGSVSLEIMEDRQRLHGQLCASVDLLLTTVKGCVGIDVGTAPAQTIPDPEPLISGIDLTDRRGVVKGRAAPASATLDAANTAWPDTVPVLHFAHRPTVALSSSSVINPGQPAAGALWSGATELKYAFRLDGVTIRKSGAAIAGPIDSVWWWPTHRGGVMATGTDIRPPSEQEGSDLALFSWHPAPWARSLSDGGEGIPADPAGTVGELCSPTPTPTTVCVLGRNVSHNELGQVRLLPDAPSAPPFSSYFGMRVVERLESLPVATAAMVLAELGMTVVQGQRAALSQSYVVNGATLAYGYQIGYASVAGVLEKTLSMDGFLSSAVDSPTLVLELTLATPPAPKMASVCDAFTDLRSGMTLGTSLVRNGVTFASLGGGPLVTTDVVAPTGQVEIAFHQAGVRAVLPMGADSVTVYVAQFNNLPIVVRGFDDGGVLLQEEVRAPKNGELIAVVLGAGSIIRVEISSVAPMSGQGGGTAFAPRIVRSAVDAPAIGVHSATALAVPRVAVPSAGGVVVVASGGVIAVTPPGGGNITVPVGGTPPGGSPGAGGPQLVLSEICYTITQQPPTFALPLGGLVSTNQKFSAPPSMVVPVVTGVRSDGSTAQWAPSLVTSPAPTIQSAFLQYMPPDPGPWRTIDIGPWTMGYVRVVSLCGATWEAVAQHDDDEQFRQDTKDHINTQASSAVGATRPLLAANTSYEIDVAYSFAGWRRTAPGQEPPPLTNVSWKSASQSFTFQTAAEPTEFGTDPASFIDESAFDPRGVFRYFIDFAPNGKGAPHFADDPVLVYLEVDHLTALLAEYNRNFDLRVRRTDPPAGSLHGQEHAPNEPMTVTLLPLPVEMMDLSDQRFVAATDAAPCVKTPPMGGATMRASVPLETSAQYDLMLVAPEQTTPGSEELLIARSHFATSRYRNETELLAALGFLEASSPFAPQELLVSAALPTAPSLGSDRNFEATMATLDLDPWPVAKSPRTVALWSCPGAWRLNGILLEADEPIERDGRLAITSVVAGTTGLLLVRSNAAGTRLLYAMPAGATLTDTAALTLTVSGGENAITASRALGASPAHFAVELL